MSDATLARMEHGKYVGVREESRRDGVCTLRKRTLYSGFVGLLVPSSMPVQPPPRRVRGVVATWLAVVGRPLVSECVVMNLLPSFFS